jgi:transcription elongation factor GreA
MPLYVEFVSQTNLSRNQPHSTDCLEGVFLLKQIEFIIIVTMTVLVIPNIPEHRRKKWRADTRMERIPITKEGLARLKEELRQLKNVERPQNVRAIKEARGHGDLNENAEYHAAKERQSFLDAKITEIEIVIGKAEVIEIEKGPADRAVFGRTVLLYNIKTDKEISYQLVGPYESDPENGKISVKSPMGQALIGSEIGDEIKVNTPGGIQEFEVVEIY